MVDVREYLDRNGRSLYPEWFDSLNAQTVAIAVTRLGQGNYSNVKSVGSGVHENKIDFGPGYRVYSGRDGERLVILLGGGTKKRQTEGHQPRNRPMAGLQEQKEIGRISHGFDPGFQRNDSSTSPL
jgi:putative addiction module killer protein